MKKNIIESAIGQSFNLLTITKHNRTEIIELNRNGEKLKQPRKVRYFDCTCDCGNVITVEYNRLKRGSVFSCGCKKKENDSDIRTKYNLTPEQKIISEIWEIITNLIYGCADQKITSTDFLRIKGLATGQYLYDGTIECSLDRIEAVLYALKFKRNEIEYSFRNNQFTDSKHKFNYVLKVISKNVNDTYDMIKRKNENELRMSMIPIENKNHKKADYQKKSEDTPEEFKGMI